MKALFYSPYLDSLGGGERYVLTLVEALNKQGWETDLLWEGEPVSKEVKEKFGIDISGTKYVSLAKATLSSENFVLKLLDRYKFMREYDLVFWLSDGSMPLLFGRKNLIHFQSPFRGVGGGSLFSQLKKLKVDEFVVNSEFTKKFIDNEFGIGSVVIFPPVEVGEITPDKKENAILYVGRFSNLMQLKGQELVLKAFKELCDTGVKNYQLWLAGSTGVGTGKLLGNLKSEAINYPVEFFENAGWADLKSLYGRAKFFWSASGYEADEENEPEKCEHFGISLVEAMAGGCVPIVTNRGGYKEIVVAGRSGILWNSQSEWLNETTRLMNDDKLVAELSKSAVERAEDFSKEKFVKKFMEVIKRS